MTLNQYRETMLDLVKYNYTEAAKDTETDYDSGYLAGLRRAIELLDESAFLTEGR